jgi:dethiobiotin synthetase
MDRLFVTGIGTGVGKTVSAAFLTQYFRADYWKPIQSGDLHDSDSMQVKRLVDEDLVIHPEWLQLKEPASPHQSAAMEGKSLKWADLKVPQTNNKLVIEGAGGLMVPISREELMIDLVVAQQWQVALVIRNYLGCINHTLLSLQALRQRDIKVAYAVMNGDFVPATKDIILHHLPEHTPVIELPEFKPLNRPAIRQAVTTWTTNKTI